MNEDKFYAQIRAFCLNSDKEDVYKYIYYLQQENKQLKEKINTYENPEDLTLMFMYCDEKSKDKIKELKDNWNKQKEVIDKLIEHINKYESIKAYYEYIDEDGYDEYNYDEDFKKELLDILKEVSE